MSRYGDAAVDQWEESTETSLPTLVTHPQSSKLVLPGSTIRNALFRIAEENKYKLRLDQI